MILTIKEILEQIEGDIPKILADSLGKLEPTDEIIRKQVPARLMRFEEGEQAVVGVISDIRKDRDDEVILPEGMDDSSYSGVVLWQHDYWREGIPHARSAWRQLDPKGAPYQVVAKTIYLGELSELGHNVYLYRKGENPLGQSIGFRSIESVRKGDTGYDDVFTDWKARVKAMLKEKEIKPTADEFSEPRRIFTKWELWEYSDVFIGSNPDALQIAVSKSIITPDEAKELVTFEDDGEPPADDQIAALIKRVADVEAELKRMSGTDELHTVSIFDLEGLWNNRTPDDSKTLDEMWNG